MVAMDNNQWNGSTTSTGFVLNSDPDLYIQNALSELKAERYSEDKTHAEYTPETAGENEAIREEFRKLKEKVSSTGRLKLVYQAIDAGDYVTARTYLQQAKSMSQNNVLLIDACKNACAEIGYAQMNLILDFLVEAGKTNCWEQSTKEISLGSATNDVRAIEKENPDNAELTNLCRYAKRELTKVCLNAARGCLRDTFENKNDFTPADYDRIMGFLSDAERNAAGIRELEKNCVGFRKEFVLKWMRWISDGFIPEWLDVNQKRKEDIQRIAFELTNDRQELKKLCAAAFLGKAEEYCEINSEFSLFLVEMAESLAFEYSEVSKRCAEIKMQITKKQAMEKVRQAEEAEARREAEERARQEREVTAKREARERAEQAAQEKKRLEAEDNKRIERAARNKNNLNFFLGFVLDVPVCLLGVYILVNRTGNMKLGIVFEAIMLISTIFLFACEERTSKNNISGSNIVLMPVIDLVGIVLLFVALFVIADSLCTIMGLIFLVLVWGYIRWDSIRNYYRCPSNLLSTGVSVALLWGQFCLGVVIFTHIIRALF